MDADVLIAAVCSAAAISVMSTALTLWVVDLTRDYVESRG